MILGILKESVTTLLWFFGILGLIGYYNDGMEGVLEMLQDPVNWVVAIVLIGISFVYRKRRKRSKESPEQQ